MGAAHEPPVPDSRWPVYVSAPSPADVHTTPSQSSFVTSAAGPPSISRQATAKARIPSGMLIRKSQRQLA